MPDALKAVMDVMLNGKKIETSARSLEELINEQELAGQKIATALNGQFVAASARSGAWLHEGDKIEIVSPDRVVDQIKLLHLAKIGSDTKEAMNLRAQQKPKVGPLVVYGTQVESRLFVGTAGYPSPQVLGDAVKAANADIITVSLRRESAGGRMGAEFLDLISGLGVKVLPNTAGCRTPRDAITTAEMARELFGTDWVKLEVIANDDTLQPDVFGLVEAAKALVSSGFKVFPYTTEDLSVAERLLAAGCQVIMPWGAPIGTGRGLANKQALVTLRAYFPGVPLVVDAGIGAPSHAAEAMELGYDAVLLNTAIAKATDPVGMAQAFAIAVKAGRTGYEAGLMAPRDMAVPSTPVAGTPFFEIE